MATPYHAPKPLPAFIYPALRTLSIRKVSTHAPSVEYCHFRYEDGNKAKNPTAIACGGHDKRAFRGEIQVSQASVTILEKPIPFEISSTGANQTNTFPQHMTPPTGA